MCIPSPTLTGFCRTILLHYVDTQYRYSINQTTIQLCIYFDYCSATPMWPLICLRSFYAASTICSFDSPLDRFSLFDFSLLISYITIIILLFSSQPITYCFAYYFLTNRMLRSAYGSRSSTRAGPFSIQLFLLFGRIGPFGNLKCSPHLLSGCLLSGCLEHSMSLIWTSIHCISNVFSNVLH